MVEIMVVIIVDALVSLVGLALHQVKNKSR